MANSTVRDPASALRNDRSKKPTASTLGNAKGKTANSTVRDGNREDPLEARLGGVNESHLLEFQEHLEHRGHVTRTDEGYHARDTLNEPFHRNARGPGHHLTERHGLQIGNQNKNSQCFDQELRPGRPSIEEAHAVPNHPPTPKS